VSDQRLTYLINRIDYGGAEIGLVRLLSELDADSFEISVITIKQINPDLESEIPNHVTLHELDVGSGGSLRTALRAVQQIRRTDIFICSLFPSIVIGSVAGTVGGVANIFSWRHTTSRNSAIREGLYKLSYFLSDGVFVDSEATRENAIQMGLTEHKITKLPISGVKMDTYPDVEYGSPNDPIRIGTVARLVESKGHAELLECATRLPNFEFHIVGDGPLAAELRASPDNVVCHGRVSQDELYRLWGTFDMYFQPSRYEGLCITAIEAMAVGLPVVASDIDGLSESIVDAETGFLVEQGDIDGYCDKIQLLGSNPDRREQLGTAGRDRVLAQFSSEAFEREFVAAITESHNGG